MAFLPPAGMLPLLCFGLMPSHAVTVSNMSRAPIRSALASDDANLWPIGRLWVSIEWGCWRGFTATDVPDHSVIKGEGDPLEPLATLAQTFHRLIKAAILSGWPG